jgi:hypothetical protein
MSVVIALLMPGGSAGVAGLAYMFIGAVEFTVGYYFGRRREAMLREPAVRPTQMPPR